MGLSDRFSTTRKSVCHYSADLKVNHRHRIKHGDNGCASIQANVRGVYEWMFTQERETAKGSDDALSCVDIEILLQITTRL